jgi:hypothetical protein
VCVCVGLSFQRVPVSTPRLGAAGWRPGWRSCVRLARLAQLCEVSWGIVALQAGGLHALWFAEGFLAGWCFGSMSADQALWARSAEQAGEVWEC